MSTSGSESNSDNDSFGELEYGEHGSMAYQYEPEYTEEELAQMEATNASRQREVADNPRQYDTDWCLCSNCISMPLPSECFCCHEFDLLEVHLDDGTCITDNIEFKTVCLNPVVLAPCFFFLNGVFPHFHTNQESTYITLRVIFICIAKKNDSIEQYYILTSWSARDYDHRGMYRWL